MKYALLLMQTPHGYQLIKERPVGIEAHMVKQTQQRKSIMDEMDAGVYHGNLEVFHKLPTMCSAFSGPAQLGERLDLTRQM